MSTTKKVRNITNTMLLWDPESSGKVKLVDFPEVNPSSNILYPCSELGCMSKVHTMDLSQRKEYAKKVYKKLISSYKMNKVAVCEVFSQLEEYDSSFK